MDCQKAVARLAAVLFCLVTCSTQLLAENTGHDSLDTPSVLFDSILVLSGKLGAPALYSSSQIEVLDEKRISAGNGQRLSNILNTANSVFIKSYGPAPQLQSISINGLGAEQTVVLLDGAKLNSFQNAMFDLSLFPKELIGAIVVQTNGASALYGSEAMGGVVNIITKNKWSGEADDGLHSSATVSVGSMNTHRWSGSTGYRKENSSLSFFLNRETSNGDYPFHFNGEKVRRKNNAYTLSDFGLSYGHIFDSTKTLSFTSFYGLQDKQIPGIETGEIPPVSSQVDNNWNSILSFENFFSRELFVKLGINFQNNYENYKVQRLPDSHFKNIVVSGENELHYKTDEFHVIAAYSFVHAALRSNQLSGLAKRNQHAIALAVESGFLKTVTLFPSIRADIIPEENKKIITYKAGINIKPFESTGFSIRGNFGKNFRMPAFNDLYWKEVGSKNINAEYSNNQEAGAWYEFNGIFSGSLDCSFIKIDATDKIIWMPQRNGKWQPMNTSKSTSRATSCNANIEKAFDGQLTVRLTAGALFTDARSTNERYPGDPTYNKLFPYVPVHTVKLAMMLQYKEFSCNLFFHHTGDRYADVENLNKMSQQNILDGNVSISQMLFGLKTTARLEVNNIANHDYQMLSDYPLPLRTYTITINLII